MGDQILTSKLWKRVWGKRRCHSDLLYNRVYNFSKWFYQMAHILYLYLRRSWALFRKSNAFENPRLAHLEFAAIHSRLGKAVHEERTLVTMTTFALRAINSILASVLQNWPLLELQRNFLRKVSPLQLATAILEQWGVKDAITRDQLCFWCGISDFVQNLQPSDWI